MRLEEADGKILRLCEDYHVHREPIAAQASRTRLDWFADLPRWAGWKSVEWLTRAFEILVAKASRIVYYLLLVVLGGSAFGVGKLPDAALCTLALHFSACEVNEPAFRVAIEGDAARNLGHIALAAVVLLPFLYKLRHSFLAPVKTIRLVGEDQDLAEMKKRFRVAKELVVHAGDFDFVGRDPEFRFIFSGLSDAGALDLVSDKSEETVRTGFGTSPEAVSLLDSLVRRNRIRFDDPKRLRCSIVRRWDYREVLYRYEHGGGEEEQHRLRICVLRGRGDVSPVVDLLRHAIRSVT
jgi:hypothetical protein